MARRRTNEESPYVVRVIDAPLELLGRPDIIDPNLGTESAPRGYHTSHVGCTHRAFFFPVHCEYWK